MRPAPHDTFAAAHAALADELLAFARARVPLPGEAEDVLQDVWTAFAKAVGTTATVTHDGSPEVAPIANPRAWLYRALRNRLTDLYRRRAARPAIAPLSAVRDPPRAEPAARADPADGFGASPPALRDLERADARDAIAAALAELPPAQAEVFVRNEWEGETLQAIARDLGIPLRTAISRKRYARDRLRRLLRDVYAEFFDVD